MDPDRNARFAEERRQNRLLPAGIQARLFLLIALVLLPMVLLLGWNGYQRYQALRRTELLTEMEVAQGVATTFATYVRGVREHLHITGQALLTFSSYSDTKATRVLMAGTDHFPAIRNLSWVNPSGVIMASSVPELVGRNLAARSYFQEILAGAPWVISDLLPHGSITETPIFAIAVEARDNTGNLRGIVVAAIGPEQVGKLTLAHDRPSGGAVAIFDRQGRLVYLSPDVSLSWDERGTWVKSDFLLQRALTTGKAQIGIMAPAALKGEWLSARVPVAGFGWVAGAGRPTDIAFASLRMTMIRDLSWTFLITTTAFLLSIFLSRTISGPLLRLGDDAKRMGKGEIPRRNEPQAPAEVENLRGTVSGMARSLLAAKEEAEEASRAKSEFLATMSHELRTPMTVIMGSLEFLQQKVADHESRQLLELADSSAYRLLGIIDDLLDISRIESGRLKVDEKPFDLRECVRQAVEMFGGRSGEKGVNLQWQVADVLPAQVRGDPVRLGQVLINLIGNAVKFTDRGQIAVGVASAGDELVFTVRDTGIGIPSDKIEQLFHPFTQVDSSLTRRHGGTGLGLAICKELLELMGGRIRVESEMGQGSTFTFTLPLRPAYSSDVCRPAGGEAREDRSLRVLLAEDDPMVRDLVKMLLDRRGADVVLAENGRRTIEKWQEGEFDVILMDLQMPEIDGLEATRMIREMERKRETRTCIFALTAHARLEDQTECLAAGMDGFLVKPIRLEELDALIDNCPCRRS